MTILQVTPHGNDFLVTLGAAAAVVPRAGVMRARDVLDGTLDRMYAHATGAFNVTRAAGVLTFRVGDKAVTLSSVNRVDLSLGLGLLLTGCIARTQVQT